MATEEQKNVLQQDTSEVPSDSELFTGEVRRELSERDVFVGDEDFYKLLADSTPADAVQSVTSQAGARTRAQRSTRGSIRHKPFSTLQKLLVTGIIAIEAM